MNMWTESTWEYLSKGRSGPSCDTIEGPRLDLDMIQMAKMNTINSKFSELQLHQIKTGLALIESLWRDFSLGTNHIALSQFISAHKYLKEIGKELFSNIFMKQSLPAQVICLPANIN